MASKKQLADPLFLQQAPEVQQSRGIRYILLEKVDPHELPHGIVAIDGVFYAFIGQIEPALQQIHSKHRFDFYGRTATFPGGVVRRNQGDPFVPWNDLLHDLQKFFPFRFLLPAPVFHITETFLLHPLPPFSFILPYFPGIRAI